MNKKNLIEKIRDKTVKIIDSEPKSINFDLQKLSVDTLIDELNNYHIKLHIQNDELHSLNQRLEHTSKLFNAMFFEAPIGYVLLDSKYKIIELNTEALKNLKLNKTNFSNLRLINYIGKGEISKFLEWSIDKSAKSLEIKFIINKKETWFLLNKTFWQDENEYIFLTLRDIQKEKNLEALKIKENKILSLTNILESFLKYCRKPLTNISENINSINENLKKEKLIKTDLTKKSLESLNSIKFLDENLIKFKSLIDFSKSNFEYFDAQFSLKNSCKRLKRELKQNDLDIQINNNFEDFTIYGNINQFEEILYKLLNFLNEKALFDEKIIIDINGVLKEDEKIISLKLHSNIEEKLISQIYDNIVDNDYLSLNETADISISKAILEYQLDATFYIENNDENCIIYIIIPRKNYDK